MKKSLLITTLFCCFFCLPTNGDAQLRKWAKKGWKKTTKGVKKAAKATGKIITAPTKSAYNTTKVIRGKAPAGSILKPFKDAASATGNMIPSLVSGLSYPQKVMMHKAQRFAYRVGGRSTAFVFDLSSFTHKHYSQLEYALAQNIRSAANGRIPKEIIAAPLAAAIRAARASHYRNSRPIPADVKRALRGYFPDAVLNKARYAIGDVEISLANLIGRVIKYGEDYAVTVGDIIVFNTNPGSFSRSPIWWTHELTHVQQYARMGVDRFAYNYMRDLGRSIEREAHENAYRAVFRRR